MATEAISVIMFLRSLISSLAFAVNLLAADAAVAIDPTAATEATATEWRTASQRKPVLTVWTLASGTMPGTLAFRNDWNTNDRFRDYLTSSFSVRNQVVRTKADQRLAQQRGVVQFPTFAVEPSGPAIAGYPGPTELLKRLGFKPAAELDVSMEATEFGVETPAFPDTAVSVSQASPIDTEILRTLQEIRQRLADDEAVASALVKQLQERGTLGPIEVMEPPPGIPVESDAEAAERGTGRLLHRLFYKVVGLIGGNISSSILLAIVFWYRKDLKNVIRESRSRLRERLRRRFTSDKAAAEVAED